MPTFFFLGRLNEMLFIEHLIQVHIVGAKYMITLLDFFYKQLGHSYNKNASKGNASQSIHVVAYFL